MKKLYPSWSIFKPKLDMKLKKSKILISTNYIKILLWVVIFNKTRICLAKSDKIIIYSPKEVGTI